MDLVIPDQALSLDEGAVDPWTKPKAATGYGEFQQARRTQGPLRRSLLRPHRSRDATPSTTAVRQFFDHLETKKYKVHVRVFLSRYRGYARCPDCHGARLRKEALYVRVGGKTIGRSRAA